MPKNYADFRLCFINSLQVDPLNYISEQSPYLFAFLDGENLPRRAEDVRGECVDPMMRPPYFKRIPRSRNMRTRQRLDINSHGRNYLAFKPIT